MPQVQVRVKACQERERVQVKLVTRKAEKLVSEQIAASETQPGFRDPTWLPTCDLTSAAATYLRQRQGSRCQRSLILRMAVSEPVQIQCAGAYSGTVTLPSLAVAGSVAQARQLISGRIGMCNKSIPMCVAT